MKRFFAVAVIAVIATPLFAVDGAALFQKKCAECHGADGSKTIPEKGVKPINTTATTGKSEEQLIAILTKANEGKLTTDEIKALAKHVKTLK